MRVFFNDIVTVAKGEKEAPFERQHFFQLHFLNFIEIMIKKQLELFTRNHQNLIKIGG